MYNKKIIETLRRYVYLMRTHDFAYNYSDDYSHYRKENLKRICILEMKATLRLTLYGRYIMEMAERKYGYV